MRSKTKKSISRLVGIWTFLLLLIFKGIFSKPADAFLSSLDACAANPECTAIVGSELSPAVAAPTAEGIGTTISTTTATEASTTVEAAAEVTVVEDRRLSGVAAFYIWNRGQNEQAQKKAAERYCQANPHDGVCAALQYQTGDAGNGDPDACKLHITRQFSYPFTINLILAPDAQCGTTTVYAIDGTPYSRGVYPNEVQQPANWKDWPQEKRDAAVKLLNDSDWQGLITSMPQGGTLNPGDTINAPTIVIPGTDGTKTYTIPDSYPNALPSPSPDPSPSPSPDPSPSPSPSPSPDPSPSPSPTPSPSSSAPTASGGSPSPSPSPDPTSTSPPPSPEPEPQPDAGGANQGGNLNWNWNSKPTFGHTFNRHGEGSKNTKGLRGRAASKGQQQGQWLNNEEAARLLKDLRPNISQPTIVEIPEGLGQVISPDGTIVPANHALVVPNAQSRGYTTAYPVVEPFPPTP